MIRTLIEVTSDDEVLHRILLDATLSQLGYEPKNPELRERFSRLLDALHDKGIEPNRLVSEYELKFPGSPMSLAEAEKEIRDAGGTPIYRNEDDHAFVLGIGVEMPDGARNAVIYRNGLELRAAVNALKRWIGNREHARPS